MAECVSKDDHTKGAMCLSLLLAFSITCPPPSPHSLMFLEQ